MKSLFKVFFAGCFLLAMILFFVWRQSVPYKKSDELIVGVCSGGFPYASIDKDGSLAGFDIELSQKIAKRLGKKIIFKDMPYKLLLSVLKIEQIDFVSSSLIINHKNLQTMDMIDIYGAPKSELTFIFWKEIPENIKKIEDLKNVSKPIALRAESVWEEVLEEHGIKNLMSLEQYHDLVLPLKYGQALAAVVGPRYARVLQKQYPEIKILKIALKESWGEGVGLGVKKGNVELKEQLEKVVKELKADGTINALKKKWFGEDVQ